MAFSSVCFPGNHMAKSWIYIFSLAKSIKMKFIFIAAVAKWKKNSLRTHTAKIALKFALEQLRHIECDCEYL